MRDRPSLTVTTTSGRIVITGEDRLDIVVDGDAAIEDGDDGGVIVRGSSSSLEVQCPADTDVRVATRRGAGWFRGGLAAPVARHRGPATGSREAPSSSLPTPPGTS